MNEFFFKNLEGLKDMFKEIHVTVMKDIPRLGAAQCPWSPAPWCFPSLTMFTVPLLVSL